MKKHTGGVWDPNGPYMAFLAGSGHDLSAYKGEVAVRAYKGCHFLVGIDAIGQYLPDVIISRPDNHWFIDSGVYVLAATYAAKMDIPFNLLLAMPPEGIPGWEAAVEKYYAFIDQLKDSIWGYIELDIGGTDRKIALRLEAEARGLRPIPVYHPLTDPLEYFDDLCREYDRVCMGNFAQGTITDRDAQLALAWRYKCRYPDVWIHLLGLRPNQKLVGYPVNSSDASVWIQDATTWSGIQPTASLRRLMKPLKKFMYSGEVFGGGGRWQGLLSGMMSALLEERGYHHLMKSLVDQGVELWPEKGGRLHVDRE